MVLTIHDPNTIKIARKLAARRKLTLEDVVIQALENELALEQPTTPSHESGSDAGLSETDVSKRSAAKT